MKNNRTINSIKNKNSIIQTIKEYDELGKENFLSKYGYGEATTYYIEHNNKEYDSKAIIGVSFKYEYPTEKPLLNSEFNGGIPVEKKLQSLGFIVYKKTINNAVIKAFHVLQKPSTIEEIRETIISNSFYIFGAQDKNINDVIRNQIDRYCDNVERKYHIGGVKYFTKIKTNLYDLLDNIIKAKTIAPKEIKDLDDLESKPEGKKTQRYTTVYERDPKLRETAIKIHGTTCKACGFNFFDTYGEHGKDYIQVHHIKPLSETKETKVNPKTDLIPLCANCHVIIHRKKDKTLTIEELKNKIKKDEDG